ncbi:MAG TPA: DEAD/DEAH box helicase [Pseudonocardia sp.]
MRTLRKWQSEAVDAVRAEWDSGVLRTAVVAATGLGKSSVIGKLAIDEVHAGGRPLLLAHREELLTQLTNTCAQFDPSIAVGRVQAGRNQTRRPITVASVATLRSEKRQDRMRRPTLVVVDECHRAVSPSHMKILSWAGAFENTRTLGVTATMTRGDKKGLGDVWESVALVRDIKFGIDEGYLVKPRGRVVVTEHMDLEHAKLSRGDYQDGELGEMVAQDSPEIVKAWAAHASDRLTVAFVPTVDSAHELRDAFQAQGITAEAVTGSTPTGERTAMYARLASGQTRVLVNVYVLVEGWDCPPVSCILMARPTRLPGVYIQALGRGLRQHPGKTDCLVLDVVGTSRSQRLVTLIDLHASAEYDTEELDAIPCDLCGSAPCACPTEVAERDPDGGRRRLLGPALYEDIDFFASSELNWLFTHGGVRFLPCGDRMAILWPHDDGLYQAGHCTVRGVEEGRYVGRDGHWDPEGPLPLNQARQRAEEWALAVDPTVATRDAGWRKRGGMPSQKQVAFAANLGVHAPDTMNKARLSDEISIALASRVFA